MTNLSVSSTAAGPGLGAVGREPLGDVVGRGRARVREVEPLEQLVHDRPAQERRQLIRARRLGLRLLPGEPLELAQPDDPLEVEAVAARAVAGEPGVGEPADRQRGRGLEALELLQRCDRHRGVLPGERAAVAARCCRAGRRRSPACTRCSARPAARPRRGRGRTRARPSSSARRAASGSGHFSVSVAPESTSSSCARVIAT